MPGAWITLLLSVVWLCSVTASQEVDTEKANFEESEQKPLRPPLLQKLDESIERQICLEIFARINRQQLQNQQNTLSEFVPGSTDPEIVRQKYIAQALGGCVLTLKSKSPKETVQIVQQLVSDSGKRELPLEKLPEYFEFNENVFHQGLTEQTELEEEMLNTLILAHNQFRQEADKRRAERRTGVDNGSQDLESLKSDYQQLFEYIKTANAKIQWDTTLYSTAGILFGFILGTTIAGIQHWRKSKNAVKYVKDQQQDPNANSESADTEKRWATLKKQKDLIQDLKSKIAAARGGALKPKTD